MTELTDRLGDVPAVRSLVEEGASLLDGGGSEAALAIDAATRCGNAAARNVRPVDPKLPRWRFARKGTIGKHHRLKEEDGDRVGLFSRRATGAPDRDSPTRPRLHFQDRKHLVLEGPELPLFAEE